MTSATIYVRQSKDRLATEAAVERQETECRALCEQRGWTVREVIRDNDTSATSGKRRAGFERLLDSSPDRIVVWHVDRLVRLSRELERVLDLGVNVYAVTAGDIDLSTPAGRAVAKTIVAWAQYEGEQKSARQQAQTRQARAAGIQPMGRHRAFGFHRDGSVNEPEAAEIRKAVDAILAGESMASVVRDWNARGVLTTEGGRWVVTTLRRMLSAPRLNGRVVTKAGLDYGQHGPIVLDDVTYARLTTLLADPRRRHSQAERRALYLLTGLLTCGRCGGPMFSAMNSGRRLAEPIKIYRCPTCHLSRRMDQVDEWVTGAVLAYIASVAPADLLAVDDLGDLRARLTDLTEERDGLMDLLALGANRAKVTARATVLSQEISEVERRLALVEDASPLSALVGLSDAALVEAWEDQSLSTQRSIIRTLPGVPVVQPLGRGKRIRPGHVTMRWEG